MTRSDHWHERCAVFKADSVNPARSVFLGDSITEEFPLHTFFPNQKPANRGISGDHIDGLIERLDLSLGQIDPQRVFIMIGINDVGERRGDTIITERYCRLFDLVRAKLPAADVLVQGLLPVDTRYFPHDPAQILRLNLFLEDECRNRDFSFMNMYPVFKDNAGHLNNDYTEDGLHLNNRGYAVWAQQIEHIVV